jgi:hypothetical protein
MFFLNSRSYCYSFIYFFLIIVMVQTLSIPFDGWNRHSFYSKNVSIYFIFDPLLLRNQFLNRIIYYEFMHANTYPHAHTHTHTRTHTDWKHIWKNRILENFQHDFTCFEYSIANLRVNSLWVSLEILSTGVFVIDLLFIIHLLVTCHLLFFLFEWCFASFLFSIFCL